MANPQTKEEDFQKPGHIFPLIGRIGGVLERRGHTEAALDLAKLTNQSEAAYICEILNEDGTMARRPQLAQIRGKMAAAMITIEELATYMATSQFNRSIANRIWILRFNLILKIQHHLEHLVLAKGDLTNPAKAIIGSSSLRMLDRDVFGSQRCDCGEQLHEAMRQIGKEGTGAILYLRQEGRGIGLKQKLQAYQYRKKAWIRMKPMLN